MIQLRCEQLENRANPGTLTASFAKGTLVLTGSATDDGITISPGSAGFIYVVGDANTPIQLGKKGPVIAAGIAIPFGTISFPVKNLTVKMGLGTDSVNIDLQTTRMNLAGNVSIDMGEGGTSGTNQDLQVFGNSSSSAPNFLTVGGNFTALAGTGVDRFSLAEISTGRNFRVTDKGGDTTNLFVGSLPVLAPGDPLIGVGGNLTITTGAGAEEFLSLIGLDIAGTTSISTGTGNPTTSKNANIEFGFSNTQTTFFRGGLSVRSDPKNLGVDSITFDADSYVNIGGKGLAIATYGGADTVTLNEVFVEGKTSISTGAGLDGVTIDGPNKICYFTGSVVVKTGADNDTLTIGSTGQVRFFASVFADLGKDSDTLTLATTGPVHFTTGFSAIFDGGIGMNSKTVTLANISGPVPTFLRFA